MATTSAMEHRAATDGILTVRHRSRKRYFRNSSFRSTLSLRGYPERIPCGGNLYNAISSILAGTGLFFSRLEPFLVGVRCTDRQKCGMGVCSLFCRTGDLCSADRHDCSDKPKIVAGSGFGSEIKRTRCKGDARATCGTSRPAALSVSARTTKQTTSTLFWAVT
jgi:hypothetical protein